MKTKATCLFVFISFVLSAQKLPEGFAYLKKENPTLILDLRYATSENFTGKIVTGYTSEKAIGTKALSIALRKVQALLRSKGLGLKVFDAYRPQSAVDAFISWAASASDTLKKREYYPNLKKEDLFELGYIAEKSGHTRGSTIDVTLVYLKGRRKGKEIDMGGKWDYFGEASHFNYQKISPKQMENRRLLRDLMIEGGFNPYEKEWWHFSLKNEPFPTTYFDFPLP
ncbi:M15 family metallopeptidase [Flavobacteriaceae bacterium]|nr:M15 family metallopeptidase [Flavobacteriaceae bacterium]MDC1031438.1 M15 family metallopeptidase [Flavobacteriaceae bacterium]MDC1056149.1 M15 family metallopeptidase [Flavobacteriaceae bacterium]MDC3368748.1 M15 family metallopeptidase [Flavobacteriaceae bacterium]